MDLANKLTRRAKQHHTDKHTDKQTKKKKTFIINNPSLSKTGLTRRPLPGFLWRVLRMHEFVCNCNSSDAELAMGPVRIRHSSHDLWWLSSHSVDLAGWLSFQFEHHDVMRKGLNWILPYRDDGLGYLLNANFTSSGLWRRQWRRLFKAGTQKIPKASGSNGWKGKGSIETTSYAFLTLGNCGKSHSLSVEGEKTLLNLRKFLTLEIESQTEEM